MSASLVGSEMCIRDRPSPHQAAPPAPEADPGERTQALEAASSEAGTRAGDHASGESGGEGA
eukprot:4650438-Alexandrium_andersonii.AAC.1